MNEQEKKEITFEMAQELGLIPDALDSAYRSVEGCSILSPAADRHFEAIYRAADKIIREKYRTVRFRGETLQVI